MRDTGASGQRKRARGLHLSPGRIQDPSWGSVRWLSRLDARYRFGWLTETCSKAASGPTRSCEPNREHLHPGEVCTALHTSSGIQERCAAWSGVGEIRQRRTQPSTSEIARVLRRSLANLPSNPPGQISLHTSPGTGIQERCAGWSGPRTPDFLSHTKALFPHGMTGYWRHIWATTRLWTARTSNVRPDHSVYPIGRPIRQIQMSRMIDDLSIIRDV